MDGKPADGRGDAGPGVPGAGAAGQRPRRRRPVVGAQRLQPLRERPRRPRGLRPRPGRPGRRRPRRRLPPQERPSLARFPCCCCRLALGHRLCRSRRAIWCSTSTRRRRALRRRACRAASTPSSTSTASASRPPSSVPGPWRTASSTTPQILVKKTDKQTKTKTTKWMERGTRSGPFGLIPSLEDDSLFSDVLSRQGCASTNDAVRW